ncbi:MAG: DUF4259 domain-containing protein [Planctomycetes bacterium]|nr:DUF4259 domain-containing protein [Planctomycetota bacterium]
MGAWGHGSFDNDDAGDWVWELEESSDFRVVKTALDAVVSESDHLEAPACSEAVAAAEIVAAALGRPVAELPDEARAWVEEHRDVPPDIAILARRAVTAIADKSELRDLWEESEYFAQWQSSMADLAARIAGQSGT